MTNPLMDGAVNVPSHVVDEAPTSEWGFDSAGICDNFQPSDGAAIDRHVI